MQKITGLPGDEGEIAMVLLRRDVYAAPQNFHVWASQNDPVKLEHESIRAKMGTNIFSDEKTFRLWRKY